MMHEASLHDQNSFITLTYDEKSLPKDGNLHPEDYQRFMKRLREKIRYGDKKRGIPGDPYRQIKYYHCGEYGEFYQRPHYHACLFNYDFPDKYHYKTVRGEKYYRSEILEELWTDGMSMIGEVTFESAGYVARYITKKITGKMAKDHYTFQDPDGSDVVIVPEYATMSRKEGIGKKWYEKYKKDLYPDDFVVMKGKKVAVPKYYDSKYDAEHPEDMKTIKIEREKRGEKHKENNTWERLRTREKVLELKMENLKRGYETNED